MSLDLPLFPEQASILAGEVNLLYLFLLAVTGFFTVSIFLCIFYFAIRYRKGALVDRTEPKVDMRLEAAWIVIPFLLTMVMFGWGAKLYFKGVTPPEDALEVYVVAKQWMWKFQHPEGRGEINELHVPLGRPVRLVMASVDVIHSLYVPVFRTKMDVVPGKYTTLWFEATKTGAFHLFCAEYCGTQHSGMIGRVVVLDPVQYERWLGGDTGQPIQEKGAALFEKLGCAGCHRGIDKLRGPRLEGLFGSEVLLEGGGIAVADEAYLREAILEPRAKLVAGYQPLMPTYQGQIAEEPLIELIAYLKSIGARSQPSKGESP